MLTEPQIGALWRDMLGAETRSLYFADLAVRATRRKQWISGASLLLASSAAAVFLSKWPAWVASSMSLVVAGLSAYAISTNLDSSMANLQKLHTMWGRIQRDYERLWNHTYEDNAELELEAIQQREQEASELATTGAPYRPKLVEKWQDWVIRLHDPKGQHAA